MANIVGPPRALRTVLAVLGVSVTLAACAGTPGAAPPAPGPADSAAGEPASVPGLVVFDSRYDVPETVRRIGDGVRAAGGTVAGTVDHAANATSTGATLAPATVVFGGVPSAGTPLMRERQQVGVDLPQKFLVWRDPAGTVRLAYNDGAYLAATAGADPAAAQALSDGSARLAGAATGNQQPSTSNQEPLAADTSRDGYLLARPSNADPATTLRRLQDAVRAKGLSPAAVVDHARAATAIGATLRPTTVLLVGNPTAGTPLLTRRPTMGIDLPLRLLVWQDEAGVTSVGHPDIGRLAERHGLPADDPDVRRVADGAAALVAAATGQPG